MCRRRRQRNTNAKKNQEWKEIHLNQLARSIDANLFSTESKRELARKCVAVQYRHGGGGADAGLNSHTMESGMLFSFHFHCGEQINIAEYN